MLAKLTKAKAEHRLGRFEISEELLREHWPNLKVVMERMVVVRAEHRYDNRTISYMAYSDLFAVIPTDFSAPWYSLEITQHGDGRMEVDAVPLGRADSTDCVEEVAINRRLRIIGEI